MYSRVIIRYLWTKLESLGEHSIVKMFMITELSLCYHLILKGSVETLGTNIIIITLWRELSNIMPGYPALYKSCKVTQSWSWHRRVSAWPAADWLQSRYRPPVASVLSLFVRCTLYSADRMLLL